MSENENKSNEERSKVIVDDLRDVARVAEELGEACGRKATGRGIAVTATEAADFLEATAPSLTVEDRRGMLMTVQLALVAACQARVAGASAGIASRLVGLMEHLILGAPAREIADRKSKALRTVCEALCDRYIWHEDGAGGVTCRLCEKKQVADFWDQDGDIDQHEPGCPVLVAHRELGEMIEEEVRHAKSLESYRLLSDDDVADQRVDDWNTSVDTCDACGERHYPDDEECNGEEPEDAPELDPDAEADFAEDADLPGGEE